MRSKSVLWFFTLAIGAPNWVSSLVVQSYPAYAVIALLAFFAFAARVVVRPNVNGSIYRSGIPHTGIGCYNLCLTVGPAGRTVPPSRTAHVGR